MKILSGDLMGKVGKEDIFKPTIGNENLNKISNDNGELEQKTFPNVKTLLLNVHCSHIIIFIKLFGHLPMERLSTKLIIF
jgi:hypothetical protein